MECVRPLLFNTAACWYIKKLNMMITVLIPNITSLFFLHVRAFKVHISTSWCICQWAVIQSKQNWSSNRPRMNTVLWKSVWVEANSPQTLYVTWNNEYSCLSESQTIDLLHTDWHLSNDRLNNRSKANLWFKNSMVSVSHKRKRTPSPLITAQ